MKRLDFVKLSERWYIDIPWIGDINDLQMVDGADELLEEISNGNKCVTLDIALPGNKSLNRVPKYVLEKIDEDNMGGTYIVIGESNVKQIWLCNVTLEVLGEFPFEIYVY